MLSFSWSWMLNSFITCNNYIAFSVFKFAIKLFLPLRGILRSVDYSSLFFWWPPPKPYFQIIQICRRNKLFCRCIKVWLERPFFLASSTLNYLFLGSIPHSIVAHIKISYMWRMLNLPQLWFAKYHPFLHAPMSSLTNRARRRRAKKMVYISIFFSLLFSFVLGERGGVGLGVIWLYSSSWTTLLWNGDY